MSRRAGLLLLACAPAASLAAAGVFVESPDKKVRIDLVLLSLRDGGGIVARFSR